ncbi:MAG: BrnA antitoxin family protein [Betaproteobacteria bacterium]|nr:BrnA antitoxin family protein [Betaproteobacteria bacterium]
MRTAAAEPYRDIDFSRAKRGPVVKPEPGKTKISIRLDNHVLEYFRTLVERAGGGNYQSMINEALFTHIHQRSMLEAVRQVVKEELSGARNRRGLTTGLTRTRAGTARAG